MFKTKSNMVYQSYTDMSTYWLLEANDVEMRIPKTACYLIDDESDLVTFKSTSSRRIFGSAYK